MSLPLLFMRVREVIKYLRFILTDVQTDVGPFVEDKATSFALENYGRNFVEFEKTS